VTACLSHRRLKPGIPVIELDCNINDPIFADPPHRRTGLTVGVAAIAGGRRSTIVETCEHKTRIGKPSSWRRSRAAT
jgi:hypothetical protein